MRIAVTLLESFRLYECGVVAEADLLARIRGEQTSSPRALLGRAYHRVLERPDEHRTAHGHEVGHYRFEPDVVEPALALIDRRGLFEVRATKRYGADTVVCKVDYILGSDITENKTRIGSFVAARYLESYQWRFELDVTGARSVTYRVFRLAEDPLALLGIEELRVVPYAQLHEECSRLVERFVQFVRVRALDVHLPDQVRELEGLAFEDSPTRPPSPHTARLKRLRDELRDRRSVVAVDEQALFAPFSLPDLAPIAEVPTPSFTLRPPFPAGRPRQGSLFSEEGDGPSVR